MFRAWVDIIMMVNHKDAKAVFDGNLVMVKRGSKITSLRQLSARWGWSKDKTSRFLNMLEADGMIKQVRDSKKTVLTVENYDFYQSDKPKRETVKRHRKDTDKDTDETLNGTNKNDKECIKNEEEKDAPHQLTKEEEDALDEAEGWGYD